jgi:CheY-like chemotaxis protein
MPVKGGFMTSESIPGITRILVVDDHDFSRRFTVAALRQCSPSVKQARTAREAIALSASWLPHLIYMDINLPDLDGRAVIEQVISGWPEDKPQPRIVILTGGTGDSERDTLSCLNADDLLVKPVSARQLRATVGKEWSSELKEAPAGENSLELIQLFAKELSDRVPELDRCLAMADPGRAVSILHQLIASSAICREPRLESSLRALDTAVREERALTRVAQAYFLLLESVYEFKYRNSAEA